MKNSKKFASFVALGASAVALTVALNIGHEQNTTPVAQNTVATQSAEHVASKIQTMRNQAMNVNARVQNDGDVLLDAKGKPVPAIWPDGTPVLDDAGKPVFQHYHVQHRGNVTYG